MSEGEWINESSHYVETAGGVVSKGNRKGGWLWCLVLCPEAISNEEFR